MPNMIDITDLSDAALEVVIRSKTEPFVSAEHLSCNERLQVALALGWNTASPYVMNWISPTNTESSPRHFSDNTDWEGMVLDRQENAYDF